MTTPGTDTLGRRCVWAATAAGALGVLLGVVVIVAWHAHALRLLQLGAGLVPMRYNTAWAFVLSGIGLVALAHGRARLTVAMALLAATGGIVALIEYGFGLHLGVDRLFLEPWVTVYTSDPGRMAPNTVLSFVVLAGALCGGARWRPPGRPSLFVAAMTVTVLWLGTMALFGYVIGAHPGYAWGQSTRMASHTAAGLVTLALGLLALWIGQSVTWRSGPIQDAPLAPARELRRIVVMSVFITAAVAVAAGSSLLGELYNEELVERRARLTELLRSQVLVIRAMTRSDPTDAGLQEAFRQVADAYAGFPGLGRTGELTLARREGDDLVFVMRPVRADASFVARVNINSVRAEPMRRALEGQSGSVVGLDYAGRPVVAVYEYLRGPGLGIVAKVDISEIREPFIRHALVAMGATFIILIIGIGSILVTIRPLAVRVRRQTRHFQETMVDLTRESVERAESARRFQRRERTFQGVYETHPDLQFVLLPDGTIVHISGEVPGQSVPSEGLVGRRIQDVNPPAVSALWERSLARAQDGKGPKSFEYWLLVDGEDRQIEGRISAMPDGRLIAIARDITEMRRVQAELIESQSRLVRAVGVSGMGFLDWDVKTDRIELSAEASEILGVDNGSGLSPTDLLDVVHPEDRESVESALQEALAEGREYDIDHRVVRPDGSVRWVHSKAQLTIDEEGEPEALLGSMEDVTGRKEVEEYLRKSEVIVSGSTDMLALVSRDFTYVVVNNAYAARYGLTIDQVVDRTVSEVMGEDVFAESVMPRAEICLGGTSIQFEMWFDFPLERAFMAVSYHPYFNEAREVIGFVVSARDVTDLEAARARLREVNRGLEHLVDIRTRQLVDVNKELEAFAYSVSHDLQAPLRAVDGYSGMLEERYGAELPDDALRLLGVVRGNAKHMALLIEDLLAFSRLGSSAMVKTDVAMRELAEDVFADLMAMEGDRIVRFSVGEMPVISADLTQIRQLWTNLLQNSLKFAAEPDKTRIDVDCTEEPAHWLFRVRDNGVGFDMTYSDKLFGVFQRLHYQDEFPGTGVGLATVARIVERHDGAVWAESEIDVGTTILFRLPRRRQRDD